MQLLESEHGSFLHDINKVNIITHVLRMLPFIILRCCMCFFTELTTWKLVTVIKMESKSHQSPPVQDQLKVWFKNCKKLNAVPRFMEEHT